jgi:hypothetical protein
MYGEQKHVQAARILVLMAGFFNDLENVLLNGQHLMTFREMFASLEI